MPQVHRYLCVCRKTVSTGCILEFNWRSENKQAIFSVTAWNLGVRWLLPQQLWFMPGDCGSIPQRGRSIILSKQLPNSGVWVRALRNQHLQRHSNWPWQCEFLTWFCFLPEDMDSLLVCVLIVCVCGGVFLLVWWLNLLVFFDWIGLIDWFWGYTIGALYLLACQVRVTVADLSFLFFVRVVSFKP